MQFSPYAFQMRDTNSQGDGVPGVPAPGPGAYPAPGTPDNPTPTTHGPPHFTPFKGTTLQPGDNFGQSLVKALPYIGAGAGALGLGALLL